MAQHGGRRSGAGRKPGVVSKAKRDIAEMAKDHVAAALNALVQIAREGESEAARVSAANAILDRAYGKPATKDAGPSADDAPALNITITAAAPIKDVRVTRSEG
ncbi:hypothetical protein [Frigidibacter sp. MR17.24]|uniref:hypothetical protein n=1 Tax=Frigidibacter sp. MR17.24 TaxID=3127345 RepID=UPI003012D209